MGVYSNAKNKAQLSGLLHNFYVITWVYLKGPSSKLLKCIYRNHTMSMVLILDGNSDIGAHVWSEIVNLYHNTDDTLERY